MQTKKCILRVHINDVNIVTKKVKHDEENYMILNSKKINSERINKIAIEKKPNPNEIVSQITSILNK